MHHVQLPDSAILRFIQYLSINGVPDFPFLNLLPVPDKTYFLCLLSYMYGTRNRYMCFSGSWTVHITGYQTDRYASHSTAKITGTVQASYN